MPQIRGLHNPVVLGQQQHITCHGDYNESWNVTFFWEESGHYSNKTLLGYLESEKSLLNTTYIWALDYAFMGHDHWATLRCIVRVDIGIGTERQHYEAQVSERIHMCGM